MLGTALMLLRGLRILIVLRALRFGTEGIKDIKPMITTIKSRAFQGSLMYDFLCRMKPKAIDFIIASVV